MTRAPDFRPPGRWARFVGWILDPSGQWTQRSGEIAPPSWDVDLGGPKFPHISPYTDAAEEAQQIERMATDLYRAGSIDEGTPTIMDGRVEATLAVRHSYVTAEHLVRVSDAERYLEALRARLALRQKELGECAASLSQLDEELVQAAQRAGLDTTGRRAST